MIGPHSLKVLLDTVEPDCEIGMQACGSARSAVPTDLSPKLFPQAGFELSETLVPG